MKKVLSIFFCAMVVLTVSAQQYFGVIGFVSGNVAYSITGPNTVEVISLQELHESVVALHHRRNRT